MRSLTTLALRRPRGVLALWAVAILVLSAVGYGVETRLSTGSIVAPGSESAHAAALDHGSFGPNETVPVLVSGPPRALDRQGPPLVAALRRHWSVLSPWDPGAGSSRLRPTPARALLYVNLTARSVEALDGRLVRVERIVGRAVRPPLAAHVTGFTSIGNALRDETLGAAATAQLIALPILALVLLIVFRAPLAAAIPGFVGFATVSASGGVIALLASLVDLTAVAVSTAAIIGLALGVDYSLLIVSRFREELAADPDHVRAARIASTTAGRTVVFAGLVLLIAMLVAVVLSPGEVLVSVTVGVTVAVVLSMLSGAVVVPALLVLVGRHVDRWRIGSPLRRARVLPALAAFATRRAPVVLAASLLLLALPATLALDVRTAALNPRVLPEHNDGRERFEAVSRLVGYGYVMPFEIALRARRGPIAEPRTLAAIARFQRRLLGDPGVAGLIGPGALATGGASVLEATQRIPRLQRRAVRAASGVTRLRAGLEAASEGAGALRDGAARAQAGVTRLRRGARRLDAGAARLDDGVVAATDGTDALAAGASTAARGADRLRGGARDAYDGSRQLLLGIAAADASAADLDDGARRLAAALLAGTRQLSATLDAPLAVADQQLRTAYDALARMGAEQQDPGYVAALGAVANAAAAVGGTNPQTGGRVAGVPSAVAQASAALQATTSDADRLSDGASQLRGVVQQLGDGATSLAGGLGRLEHGQSELSAGLARASRRVDAAQTRFAALAGGADRLAHGSARVAHGLGALGALEQLRRGGGQLAWRLFEGARAAAPLAPALRRSSHAFDALPALRGERAAAHLLLAGVESANAARRSQARYVLDVDGAGQAARLFVFPRMFPASARGAHLRDRLARRTAAFARAQDLDAALGGPAARFTDFQRVVSAFIPLLIVCLSLLTYVLLVAILRALLLPAVAIALNLAVVAATFGLMTLLFQGDDPLLGGPGYVDVTTAAGIFTILFALSLDYQVFLLTRMREGFLQSHDPDAAIAHGIAHTARVVTGAAAIMAVVFLSFSASEFVVPRQLGVGLGIAVLLDALLLRLFMLPAAMHLLGARGWWLPAPLERLLPRLDPEGS